MGFQRTIEQIRPVIVEPEVEAPDMGPAEAIAAIGDGIVNTYSGIQQNALREGVTAKVESYVQSNEGYQQGLEELPDAAVAEAMFAEQTAADAEEARFSSYPVVAEARDRTSRLASAVKAGAMNASQLKLRVQALTREYINRAPGLAQHFRRVASETLGDYNALIDSYADQARAQQQSTEFVRKQVYAQAKKFNLDVTQPYEVISQQVNKIAPSIQESDRIARQVAAVEGNKKIQDIERREGFTSFGKGKYHVAVGQAAGIIRGEGSKEDKIHALEQLKGNYAQLMMDFAGTSMSPDEVSGRISPAISQIDEYIKVVNNEREFGLVQRENDLAMQIAESDYFSRDPRLREMAVMVKKWGIKIDASNIRGMIGTLESVVRTLNGGTPIDTFDPKSPEGRKALADYYSAAKDILNDFESNPNTLVTSEDVNSILQGPIRRFNPTLMSNEELEGLMNFMARNDSHKAVQKLSEAERAETMPEIAETFDRFLMERWAPNLNSEIEDIISDKAGSQLKLFGKSIGPEGDVRDFLAPPVLDDDGRLFFSFGEKTSELKGPYLRNIQGKVRELNQRYASRFNTLVKARAHIEGSTDYGKWGKILFDQLIIAGGGE